MTRPKYPIRTSPHDFLNGLKENDLIHRYCSIEELYGIVRGKLSLTCPSEWKDKFENPLLRAKLINQKGEHIDLQKLRRKFYGKCWILGEESDAMWKSFGINGEGVRIIVKSRKLLFQASNAYDIEINEAVYTIIGKVHYLDEAEMRK